MNTIPLNLNNYRCPSISITPKLLLSDPKPTVTSVAVESTSSFSLPEKLVGKCKHRQTLISKHPCLGNSCCCNRRLFLESMAFTALCSSNDPSNATDISPDDATAMLNKIHPPRPRWYEELYAWSLDKITKSYEAEVAKYKSQLFDNLKGTAKEILEIGIGTGPNLKYYANGEDMRIIGTDPSRTMEKYARSAAETAGLPLEKFQFLQAVGESLPVSDASVDAVVGTLVLCSVSDVDLALKEVMRVLKPGGCYIFVEHVAAKDGTFLKFVQKILNPLQQAVADGCHLTRETGKNIGEAGFSDVNINTTFLSSAALVNPFIYGIARK